MSSGLTRRLGKLLLFFLCCAAGLQTQQAGKAPPAPEPPIVDIAGFKDALAKLKGKPVLVNFWATWCEPCREEYPLLVELSKKYAREEIVFLGVSFDDDAEINLVRRFLGRHAPPFQNYRLKMGLQIEFAKSVDAGWRGSIPATYVYDAAGKPLARMIGAQKREQFEAAIQLALKARERAAGSRE